MSVVPGQLDKVVLDAPDGFHFDVGEVRRVKGLVTRPSETLFTSGGRRSESDQGGKTERWRNGGRREGRRRQRL